MRVYSTADTVEDIMIQHAQMRRLVRSMLTDRQAAMDRQGRGESVLEDSYCRELASIVGWARTARTEPSFARRG